jgi:hypothetical protein
VSDATFAALQAELLDEEILELTYSVARYEMQAIMTHALRLELDDRDDRVVELGQRQGLAVSET